MKLLHTHSPSIVLLLSLTYVQIFPPVTCSRGPSAYIVFNIRDKIITATENHKQSKLQPKLSRNENSEGGTSRHLSHRNEKRRLLLKVLAISEFRIASTQVSLKFYICFLLSNAEPIISTEAQVPPSLSSGDPSCDYYSFPLRTQSGSHIVRNGFISLSADAKPDEGRNDTNINCRGYMQLCILQDLDVSVVVAVVDQFKHNTGVTKMPAPFKFI
jgi:hypothetical protein